MGPPSLPSWARAPKSQGIVFLEISTPSGRQQYPIDEKPGYLLGRNTKDCDILCDHKTCSRIHACLAHDREGRLHLADLDSVHGTFVDGKEMEAGTRLEVVPGKTSFRLGACEWTFRVMEHPAASSHQGHEDRRFQCRSVEQGARTERDERGNREARGGEHHSHGHRHRHRDIDEERRPSTKRRARERHADRGEGREGSDRHSREEWRGKSDHKRLARAPEQRQKHGSSDLRNNSGEAARPHPMSASGIGAAAQKRKLLWGKKDADSDTAKDGEGTYGANRWDAATFSNEADKQKFIKLMGVKAGADQAPSQLPPNEMDRELLSADQHAKVLTDVETHFMQGLRRADGRKVGLGL